MKKIMPKILLGLLALSLCACSALSTAPAQKQEGGKISVVTTKFPLYDFVRAVAGDHVELIMLLKPGAEIHSFEPTPADIIKMKNADLLLYVGGESELWAKRVLDSMEGDGPRTLMLMDSVQALTEELVEGMEAMEDDEDGTPDLDEHIWTSPINAMLMVSAIADALAEVDPAHAGDYFANAALYNGQIETLDKEFREVVADASRKLLVFGDRFPFRYFAHVYGLKYRAAFPGCSTDTEPAASTLAYLIDTVRNNNLPYIYYIELSNENVARAVCEQTGVERLLLHSCQQVSRDDFDAGATYVSLMRQNLENLRKGLN